MAFSRAFQQPCCSNVRLAGVGRRARPVLADAECFGFQIEVERGIQRGGILDGLPRRVHSAVAVHIAAEPNLSISELEIRVPASLPVAWQTGEYVSVCRVLDGERHFPGRARAVVELGVRIIREVSYLPAHAP